MPTEWSASFARWVLESITWIEGLGETDVASAAFEQLAIVGLAVAIAAALAIPTGLFLAANQRSAHAVDSLSRAVIAIPALALLGGMIGLHAFISFDVALGFVVTATLPALLRGVLAATRVLDRQTSEIVEILALSRSIRFRYVVMPLAVPVFARGVRDASLAAVGASTLAALVGMAGCGTIILRGIEAGDHSSVLIGSAAVLTLATFTGALGELFVRATIPRLLGRAHDPTFEG